MFKKWAHNGDRGCYIGTTDVVESVPSGLYTAITSSFGDPILTVLKQREDKVLKFQSGPLPRLLKEIQQFWKSGAAYNRLGVSFKRSILLYGPPGCGKTGIISAVIEDTAANGGIAIQMGSIGHLRNSVPLIRQIEKERPILVVMEDIESYILGGDEEEMLELLDGTSSIGQGILYLSTTNKLDHIPTRIRCRPSRVDTLVEIGLPDEEQRREYLHFLLCKDKDHQVDLDQWAGETEGLSIAALKELVISVNIYRRPFREALETIQQMTEEEPEEVGGEV